MVLSASYSKALDWQSSMQRRSGSLISSRRFTISPSWLNGEKVCLLLSIEPDLSLPSVLNLPKTSKELLKAMSSWASAFSLGFILFIGEPKLVLSEPFSQVCPLISCYPLFCLTKSASKLLKFSSSLSSRSEGATLLSNALAVSDILAALTARDRLFLRYFISCVK